MASWAGRPGAAVTSGPRHPAIATGPYGVDLAGTVSNGGAGFSVADVGDVNGDGFDDFVVGAPTVTTQRLSSTRRRRHPGGVYLVFGSATTNAGPSPVAEHPHQAGNSTGSTRNGDQRVGDLPSSATRRPTQTNPITGSPAYPFAGIKFITISPSPTRSSASRSPRPGSSTAAAPS